MKMKLVGSENKHIKRLDWIRVISCIMVFLYHLNILKGGFLAVCTFFVLSGYLSCASALKNEKFSIKTYYKKRFIKLYVPLIIIVAFTVLIIKCIKGINWLNLKPETLSVLFGYNNFWQLNANLDYFTRHVNSPFMHLWYIAILIQFDLVFPILFTLFKKIDITLKMNVSVFVVILASLVSTIVFFYMSKTQNIMTVYYNTFARCFSIIYGVLLALLLHKYNIKLSQVLIKNNKIIFMVYSLLLILLGIFISSETSNYAIYMIIASIISVRLIRYSYFEKSKLNNNFLDKTVSFIAKFSYEIYLVQYPVIFLVQNKLKNSFARCLVIIIVALIISYLIHTLINKHFANKHFNAIKKVALRINYNFGFMHSYNRKRLYF